MDDSLRELGPDDSMKQNKFDKHFDNCYAEAAIKMPVAKNPKQVVI